MIHPKQDRPYYLAKEVLQLARMTEKWGAQAQLDPKMAEEFAAQAVRNVDRRMRFE